MLFVYMYIYTYVNICTTHDHVIYRLYSRKDISIYTEMGPLYIEYLVCVYISIWGSNNGGYPQMDGL